MLCVDYSNLVLFTRNEKIASTADKLFGKCSAQVAQAACLQIGIDTKPSSQQRVTDPTARIHRLNLSQLSSSLTMQHPSRTQNGESRDNAHLVNGHRPARANGTRDNRLIEDQLALLAQGPFTFFLQESMSGSWSVDQSKLVTFLRERELLRLMSESLDGAALRIIHILVDKGKLDEKMMQDIGLLGAKELRQSLAQLQMMGFLELQEVPREPQRQPNRTMFLWFYDPERVRRVFLGKLYRAMSRLFQRLQLERERLSSTLSKVERSDVQGSEREMLSAAELEVLYQWRQKERWFVTEIHRIDESIAILRDI